MIKINGIELKDLEVVNLFQNLLIESDYSNNIDVLILPPQIEDFIIHSSLLNENITSKTNESISSSRKFIGRKDKWQ